MVASTSWTSLFAAVALTLKALPASASPAASYPPSTCRVLPGDAAWPSQSKWQTLNSTVKGKLIKTVPLATVCHGASYDKAACDALQKDWFFETVHESSASSIMTPWFQNASCDPFTPVNQTCSLGNYVSYSIRVLDANDAIAGVKFAQQNNVRLVIKNTGHDYLGKSTGAGGLGMWTHGMNSSTFIANYTSRYYSGPAFRFGSGILGHQAYTAAKKQNMRVVGGDCASVGLAGGYTQGGGHSILSSQNGMGADQVLEWEVVTAEGKHLVATPEKNKDLYWALSGGGGGTYGVVISLTVRVFPDERTGGASITIPSADVSKDEAFWKIFKKWQDGVAKLTDIGATAIYIVTTNGMTLSPFTVPGATEAEVKELLSPFTSYLDQMNRTYSMNVTSYESYFDHFLNYLGPLPNGPWPNAQSLGGRMIPRKAVLEKGDDLVAAIREAAATPPFFVSNIAMNAGNAGKKIKFVETSKPVAPNAVLPAWRDTLVHILLPGPWNFTAPRAEHVHDQQVLTNKLDPLFRKVSGPDGAHYLNEANFQQPNFKKDFYGANYPALRAVKAKYDPYNLFYATTAVGSDEWTVTGEGRLCRKR